jgi:hypothetical protein
MPEARAEVEIDRPADQVWTLIGSFDDVSWIPDTTALQIDGDIRTFRLGDSVVRHRLVHAHGPTRAYTYALADEMSSESGHANEATIQVFEMSRSTSAVVWTARLDERRGSSEGLSRFFQMILNGVKERLERG